MKRLLTPIFLLFSFCVYSQIEKIVPPVPNPPTPVLDLTNTLTPAQVQALERKLISYDDSTSSQIAIVIVNSLEGYDVAEYAYAVGKKWGVGGKEFNNGIVILIAIAERKSRIEVGYGLEGAIPDITAKSIIDNSLTPNFREGNYYRGLDQAIDNIIKAASGEYKAPASSSRKQGKGGGFGSIIFLLVLFLLLGGFGGRKGGGRSGGGGTASAAGWILGSMLGSSGRGGGWSGGGGGGGGFGGFGGGGFGGGGASGSW